MKSCVVWLLAGALCNARAEIRNAAQAGLDAERLARIPARLKSFVEKGQIAGAVTLVARRGVVASLEAVGWQDIEARKPMTAGSIFQIMSMTKPFTATGIMILLEEGKLALADPVEKHLPEFRGQRMIAERRADGTLAMKKPSRPITIRDLMTHTSGLPGMPPPGIGSLMTTMDRPLAEAVLIYSQTPLEFEPGTRWLYSNPGIATLGRIIEVLSGMAFERFLEERIFRPLGMTDSHIFLPAAKQPRLALVYRLQDGQLKRAGADILGGDAGQFRRGAQYSGPEHALYSTAADLAAFYQCLLQGGTANGKRLLSRASVDLMSALHTGDLRSGHMPGTGFGLGWEVVKDPLGSQALLSPGTFGHGGAFGTHGYIDRKRDMVGVYLVQLLGPPDGKYAFMALAASAVTD